VHVVHEISYLDFIRVHRSICHKNFGILDSPWLTNANLLVEDKTLFQAALPQASARLLDNLP
jgi:hypothetical protein